MGVVSISSKDFQPESGRGYRLLTATVFIVGEVAGGGILSLPHATAQAGWTGIAMILFCAICAGISGICLSESWLILEERYPARYGRTLTRKPFATIGMHAYGSWMSALISILLNITKLGTTTVFLLLISKLVHALTRSFIPLSVCQWIPIVAICLLLPMMLGSPADFWPIAYSAMISTVIGTSLLIIALVIQIKKDGVSQDFHVESVESFVTAFGTFLFAFGGAAAFPNFQNDMKEKHKFSKAVILGFSGLLILYIPTAALGYSAYGFNVQNSILDSMQFNTSLKMLVTIIEVFFLIHCTTAVMIIANPVYLDLEELIRIPKNFSWQRAVFRGLLMAFMTMVAETFPNFGQILDLIGATTVTMLGIILPPILYYKLCKDSQNNIQWIQRTIKPYQKVIFAIIIFCGVVAGFASAYSTLKNWSPISAACYA